MPHFGTDHLICLRAKVEDTSQLPCTAALYVILFRASLYSSKVLYKVLKSIVLLGSALEAVGHTVFLACSSSQWKQG